MSVLFVSTANAIRATTVRPFARAFISLEDYAKRKCRR